MQDGVIPFIGAIRDIRIIQTLRVGAVKIHLTCKGDQFGGAIIGRACVRQNAPHPIY